MLHDHSKHIVAGALRFFFPLQLSLLRGQTPLQCQAVRRIRILVEENGCCSPGSRLRGDSKLQNSFLFNVKEELPEGKVEPFLPDPFFGKNIFPSEEYRQTWVEFATSMYGVAVDVLRGCDKVMERDVPSWSESPRSLAKMGYDSGFTREDRLLEVAKDFADARSLFEVQA
ncbi:hypothetical protein AK812_SmicGene39496 [Symbiodinium microadriaticum]|uniref:Uncharacterized protein n=1 Tax=Symbiodinium microadriaticum TaxID=2951 RepID=A0A1Q9CB43_SYMMI|nr:hypothetical protein AK812_SmicGene39496 [Symbiodinium microadriaticum]